MDRLLGIRAVVQERGGKPLDLPPLRTYGKRVPIGDLDLRGARYLPLPNPIGELSGFGESPESGDPTRLELLFACSQELEMLGPIAFDLDLPGYRRESVDVWALPTDQGIQEQAVEASPLEGSRRDLRLEFLGIPAAASARLAVRGKLAQVVLVEQEQESFFVDVSDLSTTTLTLCNLPTSVRLESVLLNGHAPSRLSCELMSLADGVESWSVDLSGYQAVRVDLLQPDESRYLGPATLLAGQTEDQLSLIHFDRGPYVLLSEAASELCVFAVEPEGSPLEPLAAPAGQPVHLRQVLIAWQ